MKKIKIVTLFVLLMGILTVTAQHTEPGSQKSDAVPAIEQLNKAERDASQPPVISRETMSPAPIEGSEQAKEMRLATPAEPDASKPPALPVESPGVSESKQSSPNEPSGYQGRSAADPPEKIIPDK